MQNDVDTIQQDYVASLGEIYFQICCFLLAVASAIAIQPVMTLIMIAVSADGGVPKLTEKRLQAHQENEQQAKSPLSDGNYPDFIRLLPAENFQRLFRRQPRPR